MRKIAIKLGVDAATISRELKRCEENNYISEEAQEDYDKRSKLKGRKSKITLELKEIIKFTMIKKKRKK